jgi:glycosyltransferase involved in cell wall biosynthesis
LRRPARLVIAGECARPRREGRLLALGFVEHLSPLLADADIAVNPVESGSGSNVKVAEYVAAGVHVVTTRIGLRGYEHLAHRMTVADLDRFVETIEAYEVAKRSTDESSELVALSWRALGRRLHDLYTDLLHGRPRSAG